MVALSDGTPTSDPATFRMQVVAESIRLFSDNGYESTTVEQIAAAAGVSRRTLFRQFRSKEDMIFADHESLLAQVSSFLADAADEETDPWEAVGQAAELVFAHFVATRELAVRRLQVVSDVPALRERELVTTYRYQRIFEEFLHTSLPAQSRVRVVGYAAAVTAEHNYLLRSMIRGDASATLGRLRHELDTLRAALVAPFPPHESETSGPAGRRVAVVTYDADVTPAEIARIVGEQLGKESGQQ